MRPLNCFPLLFKEGLGGGYSPIEDQPPPNPRLGKAGEFIPRHYITCAFILNRIVGSAGRSRSSTRWLLLAGSWMKARFPRLRVPPKRVRTRKCFAAPPSAS